MNRHDIDWSGVIPAVTTPFDAGGMLDAEALARNVRRLVSSGANGVIVAGCTGEFWALSLEERAAAARAARGAAPDGVVIGGAAAITPSEAIEGLHAVKEAGCDGGLVMPPFFAHLSEAEIVAHFEAVCSEAPLPVVLYNIPSNAWNALTPAIVDRLADLEPVVAIKESSGDWANFHGTLAVARDRIRVFCGPSSTLGVPAVLAGCDGLMDCFPNVWPGGIELWDAARGGSLDRAWQLQREGEALTGLFTTGGRTLYPATKAAMDRLGVPGGGAPRPPLRPLSGEALAGLHAGLDRILGRPEAA